MEKSKYLEDIFLSLTYLEIASLKRIYLILNRIRYIFPSFIYLKGRLSQEDILDPRKDQVYIIPIEISVSYD
nr:MAG TPA: hypothetical protein [Caudoviricetes sp.]